MQTKFCSMSLNKWIQLNFFVFHLFSLFVALFPYRMCERRSCAHFMFFHSCVVSVMWEELLEFLVRKCRWHRHRSQPLSPRIITLSIEFCFNFSFFPSFLLLLLLLVLLVVERVEQLDPEACVLKADESCANAHSHVHVFICTYFIE